MVRSDLLRCGLSLSLLWAVMLSPQSAIDWYKIARVAGYRAVVSEIRHLSSVVSTVAASQMMVRGNC